MQRLNFLNFQEKSEILFLQKDGHAFPGLNQSIDSTQWPLLLIIFKSDLNYCEI